MQFSLSYPYWYIIICVLAGLLMASLLYFKNKNFGKKLLAILFVLRSLAISLLAFLLLQPVLKFASTSKQKPIIVVLQDNSESMQHAFKSIDKQQYIGKLNAILTELDKKYIVKKYTYGSVLKDSAIYNLNEKSTNIADALEQISSTYENENLGALILTGDGIYNDGANPSLLNLPIKANMYCVGIGDTNVQKDAIITRTYANKVAYLNDRFNAKIELVGLECGMQNAQVQIYNNTNGKIVGSQNMQFSGRLTNKTIDFFIDATKTGTQHFTASISKVSGEANIINNKQDFYVDVVENKNKVLIISNSPHPDVNALQQAIALSKNAQVKVVTANTIQEKIADYNLIVLHNLPSVQNNMQDAITQAKNNGVGLLYIVGEQTNINALNNFENALQINNSNSTQTAVGASQNKQFNFFTLNQNANAIIDNLPPLLAPFAQYKLGTNTQVLAYQKVGTANTNNALIVLQQQGNLRTGVIAAEGIWRWRLYNFLQQKNHVIVDDYINKIIQYLVVKQNKKQFRVSINKTMFNVNEAINFNAECYNDNYELITPNDVTLKINSGNNQQEFTFIKQEKNYALSLGTLAAGNYSYTASTNFNGKNYAESGTFTVVDIDLENTNTTANFNLLYQLANKYNGKFLYHNQLDKLQNLIVNNNNIKNVLVEDVKTESLINWKSIFGIALALLSLEWFLRKRNGGY